MDSGYKKMAKVSPVRGELTNNYECKSSFTTYLYFFSTTLTVSLLTGLANSLLFTRPMLGSERSVVLVGFFESEEKYVVHDCGGAPSSSVWRILLSAMVDEAPPNQVLRFAVSDLRCLVDLDVAPGRSNAVHGGVPLVEFLGRCRAPVFYFLRRGQFPVARHRPAV